MRLLAKPIGRPRIPTVSAAIATALGRRHLTNNGFFRVSEEVREALHSKKPVVALETTIYTHGFPYPENVALASLLESVVRTNGGIPATIGILDGVARIGLDPEELIRLASTAGQSSTLKLSRRDLGYVGGMRLTNKSFNGGTTISGTMLLAHLAGIKIFGTGGLGGVHRGAESTMDISADLTELGRTPVAVIASGCKSFLDIPRTIEYLETEGVGISTFADGRPGNVDFPAFWSRDSGVRSPTTIADEIEAAAIIYAQHTLQITSGLLFANPIPIDFAIPKEEMDVVIAEALRQADASHISGKDNTPFVLAKIKELTNGKSIPANRGLIESNVKRATVIARELAILEAKQEDAQGRTAFSFTPVQSSPAATTEDRLRNASLSPSKPPPSTPATNFTPTSETKQIADIVVAGALAVDFSCDYAPLSASASNTDPLPHTSNPAIITQTLGGVAHNIAKASHLLGSSVRLHSAVGDDLSGRAAIAQLQEEGMSVSGIETLPGPSRTAQYVAINNTNKDLALAMADMSILETIPDKMTSHLATLIFNNSTSPCPKVFVADANCTTNPSPSVYPHPLAHITTPNIHELTALYTYAEEKNIFSTTPSWFTIIDALGIPTTGLRVPLALTVGSDIVDRGIPQQAIKLLPFFPTILTKLGPEGVLMTRLLPFNDPALQDDTERQFVLARNMNGDVESGVGGLYVRLFPVEKVLQPEEVISVNGIGDTFCGALAHALSQGRRIQDVVAFAQRAASLSLRSREAVSPELKGLRTVVT
ncbi:hypothetical protein HRS9139_03876 [Pyrenophora teres f. teres]|nr:hypothetical protein HRS9139_03876 [Pyrenophora teres f. teres]